VNTVRRAVVNARYGLLDVRIGGPGASMKGQWPMLLACAALVFGCFFVIGRLGSAGPPPSETSSALRAFSGSAAIPGALRGDSPIAGSVPSAIGTRPTPLASEPAVAASGGSRVGTPAQPFADSATQAVAPSVAQVAPVVKPVPVEAPAPSAQHSGASSTTSGSGGNAQRPSSSSGSFDSSE
jgi:hypothetical protein